MTKANDGTKHFKFPQELIPYKNLIYVPLDLETPVVDEAEFLKWFESAYLKDYEINSSDGVLLNGEASKKLLPSQNNKNVYPWKSVYLRRNLANLTDHYHSCLTKFPAIKNYIENLPFESLSTINILKQEPGVDVGIHTDYDLWFGIRFYLVNSSNARIFFQKAKTPNTTRLTAFTNDGNRIPWNEIVESEKVYARYPTPNCSFHLTCTHAAHGVEAVPEDIDCSRITFFFSGKLDFKKYAELLERSLQKYGNYAIWH